MRWTSKRGSRRAITALNKPTINDMQEGGGKWVVATEALYEGKHPTKKKMKIHKDNYGRNSECIQSAVSLELDPGIY